MAVKALVMPDGITTTDLAQDFSKMLLKMAGGKAYLADVDGTFTKADADALCASQTALQTGLADYTLVGSKMAEDAGDYDSSVSTLKYRGGSVPGKRTNKLNINILGLSAKQKNYFESEEFGGLEKVLVLTDVQGKNVLIIANTCFSASFKGKVDDLFKITLSSEFTGETSEKVFIYPKLVVGA